MNVFGDGHRVIFRDTPNYLESSQRCALGHEYIHPREASLPDCFSRTPSRLAPYLRAPSSISNVQLTVIYHRSAWFSPAAPIEARPVNIPGTLHRSILPSTEPRALRSPTYSPLPPLSIHRPSTMPVSS